MEGCFRPLLLRAGACGGSSGGVRRQAQGRCPPQPNTPTTHLKGISQMKTLLSMQQQLKRHKLVHMLVAMVVLWSSCRARRCDRELWRTL